MREEREERESRMEGLLQQVVADYERSILEVSPFLSFDVTCVCVHS